MNARSAGRAAAVAAVWVVCTALAAFSPVTPLRVAALVVFLVVLPLSAGYAVQRRLFGAASVVDLRVGAAIATTLLVLLAVGAVFIGFGIPLDRWALVLALGVLSALLVVAARLLPQAGLDPIDEPALTDAQARPEAPDATATAPLTTDAAAIGAAPRRRRAGVPAAYGVTGVFLAAAVAITVVSQSHFDHRRDYTALSVQQSSAGGGVRTYRLTVTSHDTHDRNFVLQVRITGRPARTLAVPLPAGATWTGRISAPAASSLSASLAFRSTPNVPYRHVNIGH